MSGNALDWTVLNLDLFFGEATEEHTQVAKEMLEANFLSPSAPTHIWGFMMGMQMLQEACLNYTADEMAASQDVFDGQYAILLCCMAMHRFLMPFVPMEALLDRLSPKPAPAKLFGLDEWYELYPLIRGVVREIEALSAHPGMAKRFEECRQYAVSDLGPPTPEAADLAFCIIQGGRCLASAASELEVTSLSEEFIFSALLRAVRHLIDYIPPRLVAEARAAI